MNYQNGKSARGRLDEKIFMGHFRNGF